MSKLKKRTIPKGLRHQTRLFNDFWLIFGRPGTWTISLSPTQNTILQEITFSEKLCQKALPTKIHPNAIKNEVRKTMNKRTPSTIDLGADIYPKMESSAIQLQ